MARRPWAPHRSPDTDLQLEACDICGTLVPRTRLRPLSVQGLAGKVACDLHEVDVDAPTYRDFRSHRPSVRTESQRRLPPTGAPTAPWEGD